MYIARNVDKYAGRIVNTKQCCLIELLEIVNVNGSFKQ